MRLSSACGPLLAVAALTAAVLGVGCKSRPDDTARKPTPTPAAQQNPRLAAGEAAYFKYCALCHGVDARGYAADNAPSLVSETFLASAGDAFLSRSIREGRPGTAMAGYGRAFGGPLAESDVLDLMLYLRSKGPPLANLPSAAAVGVAARGKEIYERECVRCHGTPGERGTAIHLANASFLAMATDDFLRHAIMMGRPGTAMRSYIADLNPSQIDDVIAHLRSWAAPPVQRAATMPEIPDVPIVLNEKGPVPKFTLRDNRFVPAAEVKKALDARSRIVIVDARATSDWHLARITGAISVPYYGFSQLDKIPKDDKTWVVAYCACPHHASGVVVDELRKRGYKNTAVLDEGILEWQKRNYPTEGSKGPPPPPPGPAGQPDPRRVLELRKHLGRG